MLILSDYAFVLCHTNYFHLDEIEVQEKKQLDTFLEKDRDVSMRSYIVLLACTVN